MQVGNLVGKTHQISEEELGSAHAPWAALPGTPAWHDHVIVFELHEDDLNGPHGNSHIDHPCLPPGGSKDLALPPRTNLALRRVP